MPIEDKLLMISAKYIFGPVSKGIGKVNEHLEAKTGKGLYNRMAEAEAQDNKLKEKNTLLWAAKKIGIGTLKGLFGTPFSKD